MNTQTASADIDHVARLMDTVESAEDANARAVKSTVLSPRAVSIQLRKHQYGVMVAMVNESELMQSADFVLAVRARMPQEQLRKLGSVGREWAGSGAIRLLDENRQEVADGEVGELFSRTAYVFDGYWKNPDKTAEAFRGDWCSVGDMARRDEEGFIWLVDRKSNMIISGGENVYPSEVEGALGQHPQVRDVAVIGVPHDKWGETVKAVVVLHQGETATEADLRAWCRQRLAGYKCPSEVVFINDADMPRTATGKILHRVLRQRYMAL